MAATTTRDVGNHVLFEVATEVANRGTELPTRALSRRHLTFSSWRYLLGPQIQGAGHHGRVWRILHTHRTLEQGVGTSSQPAFGQNIMY